MVGVPVQVPEVAVRTFASVVVPLMDGSVVFAGGSGATTARVRLNRWRGVNIGEDVWIGYDSIIETSHPHLVTIRDRAAIGIRATIIAHNREQRGVVIEEDAVLGPGTIVLPNVTIGRGAIVTAGSVVTKSVPPKTMVQGNPARTIALVEVPLGLGVSVKEFAKGLRSVAPASRDNPKESGE